MNRISFKGSSEIVGHIVSLISGSKVRAARPPRYERRLREMADAGSADPECLGILFDFLVACKVPEEKLDRLTGERAEVLASLARDVETLRRYRGDGTIVEVRVVDEWPF